MPSPDIQATCETDPVSPKEDVLRRFVNSDQFYTLSAEGIVVERTAFEPTKRDTDGISVYRLLFATPAQVAECGKNSKGYFVARLLVADILQLNLHVEPAPTKDPPKGHSLIRELRIDTEKKRSKELQRELAKLATRSIVHYPAGVALKSAGERSKSPSAQEADETDLVKPASPTPQNETTPVNVPDRQLAGWHRVCSWLRGVARRLREKVRHAKSSSGKP